MSASVRTLLPVNRFKRVPEPYARRVVATLPEPYQKFFAEWKDHDEDSTPIHWIPRKEKWIRNPETGEVKAVQNEPIPVKYPNESHEGIWGGEGVVEGLIKKAKYRSPVPKFWVPVVQRSVVRSEILDKYFSMLVTETGLRKIDEHYGLDSYLLKNPAYEIKSVAALKLKRLILLALIDKDFCHEESEKQNELYETYRQYIIPREDADWYGLTVPEARAKWEAIKKKLARPVPLKYQLRADFIKRLQEEQLNPQLLEKKPKEAWTQRLNPFSKPAHIVE